VIAYSRPFWPLFLHVLGAMTLFGGILTVLLVSVVAWGRPGADFLRRAAFFAAVVSIPDYIVMRAGAQWIYSKEGWTGHGDPTWLGIGFAIADGGLLLLLLLIGLTYWWRRSGKAVAGRIVTGVSALYLVLLGVAWLAMSGKWGS
jgi:hypothetical protein